MDKEEREDAKEKKRKTKVPIRRSKKSYMRRVWTNDSSHK